jgi:hypothetical protein
MMDEGTFAAFRDQVVEGNETEFIDELHLTAEEKRFYEYICRAGEFPVGARENPPRLCAKGIFLTLVTEKRREFNQKSPENQFYAFSSRC